MSSKKKYKIFCIVMIIMIVLSVIRLLFLDTHNQLQIFHKNGTSFMDDYFVTEYASTDDPYLFLTGETENVQWASYPPMVYVLGRLYNKFLNNQNTNLTISMLTITSVIIFFIFVIINNVSCDIKNKTIICFCFIYSEIMLFSFERGNTVLLSSLFTMFFFFYYDNENKIVRELSLLALAFSASIKITPAIFGVVLLNEKRYFEAFRCFFYGILLFFIPFLLIKGQFNNVALLFRNIKIFSEYYKNYLITDFYNFKSLIMLSSNENYQLLINKIYPILNCAIFVISIVLSFVCKEKWKRVLLVCLSIAFVSSHSPFYMGLYFFPGIILFLNCDTNNVLLSSGILISILLILNPFQIVLSGVNVSFYIYNISLIFIVLLLISNGFVSLYINIVKRKHTADIKVS